MNSQLVVSQVTGDVQVKKALVHKYLSMVKKKIGNFDSVEISHIPREQNTRADILSKLASTRVSGTNHSFAQETLEKPSYGMDVVVVATVKSAP
jgi:ribonuclease HI